MVLKEIHLKASDVLMFLRLSFFFRRKAIIGMFKIFRGIHGETWSDWRCVMRKRRTSMAGAWACMREGRVGGALWR